MTIEPRLTSAGDSASKQLAKGVPSAGLKLSFSGLPSGTVTVTLSHRGRLATGSAMTQKGRASVRLRLTAAGRKALTGTGTLKATLTVLFTPSAGGKQTKLIRQVAVARQR